MRVAVLELPARWGEPARALTEVDALLGAAPAELVLLPETSLTGYVSPRGDFDLTRFAESLDGPSANGLRALALRHQLYLVGPLIERDGPRVYNSMIGFAPDGARILHYRKRHPWMPEEWASAGELPYPLVEIGGLRVTMGICYDVHFLAGEAARQLTAADLLLFPSAWVEEERDSRPEIFAQLAARFGATIANANWGAGAVKIAGQGGSCIYSAAGIQLAKGGRADAQVSPKPSR